MRSSSYPAPEAINSEDTLTDVPIPQDLDSDVHAIRELPSFFDEDDEKTQVQPNMRAIVAEQENVELSKVTAETHGQVQDITVNGSDEAVWLDPTDLEEVTEVPADCLVRGFEDEDK